MLLGIVFSIWQQLLGAAEALTFIAATTDDNPKMASTQQAAVVAGGCFWGMQGVFEHVKGVLK